MISTDSRDAGEDENEKKSALLFTIYYQNRQFILRAPTQQLKQIWVKGLLLLIAYWKNQKNKRDKPKDAPITGKGWRWDDLAANTTNEVLLDIEHSTGMTSSEQEKSLVMLGHFMFLPLSYPLQYYLIHGCLTKKSSNITDLMSLNFQGGLMVGTFGIKGGMGSNLGSGVDFGKVDSFLRDNPYKNGLGWDDKKSSANHSKEASSNNIWYLLVSEVRLDGKEDSNTISVTEVLAQSRRDCLNKRKLKKGNVPRKPTNNTIRKGSHAQLLDEQSVQQNDTKQATFGMGNESSDSQSEEGPHRGRAINILPNIFYEFDADKLSPQGEIVNPIPTLSLPIYDILSWELVSTQKPYKLVVTYEQQMESYSAKTYDAPIERTLNYTSQLLSELHKLVDTFDEMYSRLNVKAYRQERLNRRFETWKNTTALWIGNSTNEPDSKADTPIVDTRPYASQWLFSSPNIDFILMTNHEQIKTILYPKKDNMAQVSYSLQDITEITTVKIKKNVIDGIKDKDQVSEETVKCLRIEMNPNLGSDKERVTSQYSANCVPLVLASFTSPQELESFQSRIKKAIKRIQKQKKAAVRLKQISVAQTVLDPIRQTPDTDTLYLDRRVTESMSGLKTNFYERMTTSGPKIQEPQSLSFWDKITRMFCAGPTVHDLLH